MSNTRIDASPPCSLLMASQSQIAAELGGDANAQVAALMLAHARDTSEQLRGMRQSEQTRLQQHQQGIIQAMRDKAQETYMAACACALGQLVGGAMTVAGGVCSAPGVMQNAQTATSTSQTLQGSGSICSALGQTLGANWQRAAGLSDTRAAIEEQNASTCWQRLETLRSEQAETHEMTRTAIAFLRQTQASQEHIDRACVGH